MAKGQTPNACRGQNSIMGLRDRMQERRAENQGITVYQMRQKLLSIGDDFWIEDSRRRDEGEAVRVVVPSEALLVFPAAA